MKDGKPWLPGDEVDRAISDAVFGPRSNDVTRARIAQDRYDRVERAMTDITARCASTEVDPNGLSPHTPGAKLDEGKNRLGLVLMDFASALMEVGKVGTYGAKKYTDHGWVTVLGAEQRYTDALFRHLLAEGTGELQDPDTHLLHAAHVAWNALARLRFIIERQQGVAPNAEATCPRQ